MQVINGILQFHTFRNGDFTKTVINRMNGQTGDKVYNPDTLYQGNSHSVDTGYGIAVDFDTENKPAWNEDHSIAVYFIGEIYNYHELKEGLIKLGHLFLEDSQAEVIAHGFESFGSSFFDRLEGVFSLCVYLLNERKCIIVRDRFGEYPLYYYYDDNCFLFSTKLKSIARSGIFTQKIDTEALSYYLQLTYIPAPFCIYENVRKVMPATYVEISMHGEVTSKNYWKLSPYNNDKYSDYDFCKKQLREALFESVSKRMNCGESLGAFLSGGFDSSIVVGLMSQISSKPINTFTVGFDQKEFDETRMAGLVSKKNGTNHRILNLDWVQAEKSIDDILDGIDEPYADSSLIASYAISNMTGKYVDVALTGDAGDEIFAGYNKYLIGYYTGIYKKLPGFVRTGVIEPLSKKLPKSSSIYRRVNKVIQNVDKPLFDQRISTMSLGFKYNEAQKLISFFDVKPLKFVTDIYEEYLDIDEQKRAQYLDMNVVLEGDMLPKMYYSYELSSLKTRSPILDKKIVEMAFAMPTKYKIKGKERKIILKDAFSDFIPEELYHTKKKGFSVPIGYWLENNLREQLIKYSDRNYLEDQGLFSWEYIQEIIENHFSHKENRYSELWTFYVFQKWYEREFC